MPVNAGAAKDKLPNNVVAALTQQMLIDAERVAPGSEALTGRFKLRTKDSVKDVAERYLLKRAAIPSTAKVGASERDQTDILAWYINQSMLVLLNFDSFQKADYLRAMTQPPMTAPGKSCLASRTGVGEVIQGSERARRMEAVLHRTLQRVGLEDSAPLRPSSDYVELAMAAAMAALVRPGSDEPLPIGVTRLLRGKVLADSAEEAEMQCELQNWVERQMLRDPSRFKTELDALFFKMVDFGMASVFAQLETEGTATSSGYPRAALLFSVEGSTAVEATITAEGRATSANIVKRSVTVPGVLRDPPVGFERIFDAAAIKNAMTRAYPITPSSTQGDHVEAYELQWKLDDRASPAHASGRPAASPQ